ncbi:MAG: NADH-quinone oxidoreductase subunit NuoG [Nitrospirota bacterium]
MAEPLTSPVTLTIDGKTVTVEKGTYVIRAAEQAGIHIPYFCSHIRLKPDGNCRMCLVEVEKMPKLQTACNLPVAEGMVVRTSSDKAVQAQEGVMEFLLANHPLDCPLCDQGGECELQDRAHLYSDNTNRNVEPRRAPEKRYFSPFIEREMSRCIQCLRCTRYCGDILDVRAIVPVNRGNGVEISTFMDQELNCEFCGGCVQICPVGAFTSRVVMYDYRPWQLKKTETVCTYCADGCSLRLETKITENEVVRVTSDWKKGRNMGDLCARGYFGYHFINSPDRLAAPLVREGQTQAEWPLIEAIERAAQQLTEIKRRYGPEAIGGVISARCTNEEAYLFQKLMRLAIGTPHVDSSSRDGHLNSVRALRPVAGHARMTAPYEAIEAAQVVMVIGSDMTETNPITGLRVKTALRDHGATLITVGPYLKEVGPISNLVNRATLPLTVRPGTEGLIARALVKAVVEEGLASPSIASAIGGEAPAYVERIRAAAGRLEWNAVEEQSGASTADIKEAARRLASAERAVILFGQGITRQAGGYEAVGALADLAILTGLYAKEGSGLNPLCEENNEMGVAEMGAAPEYLPGLMDAQDPAARQRFRELWKEELPAGAGWSLAEMLEQARQGRLKALYLVGEDPLGGLPALSGVREALQSLELLICQDLFLTETGKAAHIVLPASSFAEKEGTVTNHEGRVQKIRRAIEPVGESLPDWELFSQLAGALGYPLEYASAGEITEEIGRAVPGYGDQARSDHDAIRRYVATVGEEALRARYQAPAAPTGRKGPAAAWQLIIGQSLYHSGKLSRRASELQKIEPAGRLQLNPQDADRLGVEEGDMVRMRRADGNGAAGDVLVPVARRPKIPPGSCRFPGHFAEAGVRHLADWSVDPVTHVPYFRSGRVLIERAPAAGACLPASRAGASRAARERGV